MVFIKLWISKKQIIIQVGDTVDPYLVKTPKVTDDWDGTPPNENKGETHSSEVENSGIWSIFIFWPKLDSVRYKFYCIPTGCVPVPKTSD